MLGQMETVFSHRSRRQTLRNRRKVHGIHRMRLRFLLAMSCRQGIWVGQPDGAVVEPREIVFRCNFEAAPQPEESPDPAGGCVGVPRQSRAMETAFAVSAKNRRVRPESGNPSSGRNHIQEG